MMSTNAVPWLLHKKKCALSQASLEDNLFDILYGRAPDDGYTICAPD